MIGGVEKVNAMQASLRVPNLENLRQATVMPERLTKKLEVEKGGSKIQKNTFAGFKSSCFASAKSTRAFLESSVYATFAKVVKQLRQGRTRGGTPMTAEKGLTVD